MPQFDYSTNDSGGLSSRHVAVWLTHLRRSGVIAHLSAPSWQTLTAILSFLTREGGYRFSLDQLAYSLRKTREEAEAQLSELANTLWREEPLVALHYGPDGGLIGVDLAQSLFPAVTPPVDTPVAVVDAPPAKSEAQSALSAELEKVGLYPDQIEWLLENFPEERITRQLGWLPQRKAANPAAYLLRAIEQNWTAPRGVQ